MATSSIAPPLLRPFMLLISICTTVLNLTACETDSTESAHSRHPYNLWQPCPIWGQRLVKMLLPQRTALSR